MSDKEGSGSVIKVPVFVFPTECWRCGRSIRVLFPADEKVAKALPGTLKLVGGDWVNVCPYCKAPYGNWYLTELFLDYAYRNIKKYCIGFITWEPRCVECGKPIRLEERPLVTDLDYANVASDYISDFFCDECARKAEEEERQAYMKYSMMFVLENLIAYALVSEHRWIQMFYEYYVLNKKPSDIAHKYKVNIVTLLDMLADTKRWTSLDVLSKTIAKYYMKIMEIEPKVIKEGDKLKCMICGKKLIHPSLYMETKIHPSIHMKTKHQKLVNMIASKIVEG